MFRKAGRKLDPKTQPWNTNYSPFPFELRIWRQLQIEWFREMDQVSVEIGPFVNTFPHLMVVIKYISEMAVLFIE